MSTKKEAAATKESLESKFLLGNISHLPSRWQSWLVRVQGCTKFHASYCTRLDAKYFI